MGSGGWEWRWEWGRGRGRGRGGRGEEDFIEYKIMCGSCCKFLKI